MKVEAAVVTAEGLDIRLIPETAEDVREIGLLFRALREKRGVSIGLLPAVGPYELHRPPASTTV